MARDLVAGHGCSGCVAGRYCEQLLWVVEGRLPSVTSTVLVEPPLTTVRVTLSPGARVERLAVSASAPDTAVPSTAVMTSPALSPALSAGAFVTTQPT